MRKHATGIAIMGMIVLIVVFGVLVIAASHFFIANMRGVTDSLQSKQAFYLAEAGVQRGIRQFGVVGAGYTGQSATTMGAGTYTIEVLTTACDGTTALAANSKRIRGIGVVGNNVRTVDAVVGPENLLGNVSWDASGACVPQTTWTITTDWTTPGLLAGQQAGLVSPSVANCPDATQSPNLVAQANTLPNSIWVNRVSGAQRNTIATQNLNPVYVYTTGGTFTISYVYWVLGTISPAFTRMTFQVCTGLNATGTCYAPAAPNDYNGPTGGWANGTLTSTAIPAGTTLRSFRITLNVQGGSSQKTLYVDQVTLPDPGGGLEIIDWCESFPS